MSSPMDTNQSAVIPETNYNDDSEELFLTPTVTYTRNDI